MGRTPPGETRERVFRFMRERLLSGRPPTVREVQAAFRFKAVQTAREHLETLVAEGRLTKERARHRSKARGYRLPAGPKRDGLPRDEPPVLVPVLGQIQAGPLDLAVEDLEGYIPIHSRRSGDELSGEFFGLKVRGESMRDAGILPGDVVVVRRQATAESGDIVVALVGDEATIKRFRRRFRKRQCRIELHPENPEFDPICPAPDEVTILGKVIELRRFLD
jgi:repressor LexA